MSSIECSNVKEVNKSEDGRTEKKERRDGRKSKLFQSRSRFWPRIIGDHEEELCFVETVDV